MIKLGDAAVFLGVDSTKLDRGLDSAQQRVKSVAGGLASTLHQAFSFALGNAISAGFSNITASIRSTAAGAFEAVASNETLVKSYQALQVQQLRAADSTISYAEALAAAVPMSEQLYAWTLKLAIKSPFSEEDISKALQMGQSFKLGTQRSKELTEALVNQASATGRNGEAIQQATRAVGQISAKNRVQMEELNQLSEAGIDYIRVLDQMGVTLDDVARGTVNADEFIKTLTQTLKDDFAGAADAGASSWTGLLNSLQDITRIGARTLFQPLLDSVKPVAAALADAFSNPAVTTGLKVIGESVAGLLTPAFQSLVSWIEKLPEKIQVVTSFLTQLRDELRGLSAADILGELGPGLAKLQADLDSTLATVGRAHVGTLKKLETDIAAAGDKLAEEMASIAEKYAPDIAKLQQRISDATADFNQRETDQAEQFAKKRAEIEKRLAKQISDQEEKLTELKRDHQRRRQGLIQSLLLAETEEQYLAIQQQIKAEDEKFNEQKTKTEQAGKEQTAELRAQLAEQEAEQAKQEQRLAQQRERAFRDLNQQMAEITAKRTEEEGKVQEAYNSSVEALQGKIQAENEAYEQQRADLQAAFAQQQAELEASTTARAEAIGKGMAHTIATFLKEAKAVFDEAGLAGLGDLLLQKLDDYLNSEAGQARMEAIGQVVGEGIVAGIGAVFGGEGGVTAWLLDRIQGRLGDINRFLDTGQAAAKGFLTGMYEAISGQEASEGLSNLLGELWRAAIQQIITTVIPPLGYALSAEAFTSVSEGFANQKWSDIGKNIWEGITGGLAEAARGVRENVEEAGSDLLEGIQDFFGIHSESKLFRDEVGAQLAAGLGQGFQAGMGDVARKAQDALKGLTPGRLEGAMAAAGPKTYNVSMQPTFNLPQAPAGFDADGYMKRIQEMMLGLMLELEGA